MRIAGERDEGEGRLAGERTWIAVGQTCLQRDPENTHSTDHPPLQPPNWMTSLRKIMHPNMSLLSSCVFWSSFHFPSIYGHPYVKIYQTNSVGLSDT